MANVLMDINIIFAAERRVPILQKNEKWKTKNNTDIHTKRHTKPSIFIFGCGTHFASVTIVSKWNVSNCIDGVRTFCVCCWALRK